MFCSTIIPTVGRSTLARAVESVLTQTIHTSDFEIIVVNDSGNPLVKEDWQKSNQVQVVQTNRRERSVARNTGAAIARGQYLHFLDDDDWLAPDAYQHFQELSQSTDARWLYGITQVFNRRNKPTIQLKHNLHGNCFVQAMAGEWIPLQASLIERNAFFRIGGFNPLLTGPEDIDLLRRFLLEEDAAETSNLVANVIMGEEGSTTDYDKHPQASRWAREFIIDSNKTFNRMRLSANDPFWKGRMTRVYLTSVVWNLNNKRFLIAASRVTYSLTSMATAGADLLTKGFWRAIISSYASITFEKGRQEVEKAKQLGT